MGLSRKKLHPQQHKSLRSDPRTGVEDNVANTTCARGNKALVPFVQASYQGCTEHRDVRPAKSPSCASCDGQRLTPGAEQQDTEQAVPEYVAAFANEEVPMLEMLPVQAEQEMQQRIENPAGVVSGERRTGLDGDDDQPQDRCDPGLENMMTVGSQAAKPGCPGPDSRGRLSPHRPCHNHRVLLDRIVRGLAGNHHVVDMALAQAGAADAHEARLLQQFGNGRAAAVAHAGFQAADHLIDDHRD